ncbi:hypothetical protein PHYSODRAFT_330296 [Phytophthora sojae]|uniref:RxLR effector protein n=1 Tax=Phytophthora sojae (strain P6497) TaxID=1094619 RepID=G4Z7Y7_PHYSP|nr:hypothetical protein PHYSODRAFT_330296 [Phytophthora sojae]EGZ22522.1 hypothetical protein PHYSODRAFT_330296 [Phytophthora sojae]|eukprot:XP_009525239.1 hypothetical protein PHYSODRAFT_330296 [Phytophthora sojae]
MNFSYLLKAIALLALLALNVNAATLDQARRLRAEPSIDHGALLPERQLSGMQAIRAVTNAIKKAFNYPIVDKAKENYEKIKHATTKNVTGQEQPDKLVEQASKRERRLTHRAFLSSFMAATDDSDMQVLAGQHVGNVGNTSAVYQCSLRSLVASIPAIALLALLALNVNAATLDQARRLRAEPSIDHGALLPERQLSGMQAIRAVTNAIKKAFNYPIVDKAKENYEKIKHATTKK